jgi:hypothetical protein
MRTTLGTSEGEAEDIPMAFVRKCEQCGRIDDREQWKSASDAADQGAFQNWTCPNCAWTEFELVDTEAEPAQTAS